jgi:hypothetical protein
LSSESVSGLVRRNALGSRAEETKRDEESEKILAT